MTQITIYTKAHCPYCNNAKMLFDSKKLAYTEIAVDNNAKNLEEMLRLSDGRRTVPQIFINGHGIGGFDDLAKLVKNGELEKLL